MVDAPEKLWMTAEEMGWPGSFRSFRMSDLEHPEDEYPAYVRADLYEQVKRERDEARSDHEWMRDNRNKWQDATTRERNRAEAAERLAGARVKALEWSTNWGTIKAETPIGHYFIEARRDGSFDCRLENIWKTWASSSDAAKAAAQADYERRILSALAEPAGEAEPVTWQHMPGCGEDRESKMLYVTHKVFCDPCIAPLVAALNTAGIETVASCCGHGHRPGVIALRDGRELFITKDFDEARQVDAIFPIDINGNTRHSEHVVTEEMVERALEAWFDAEVTWDRGMTPPMRARMVDSMRAAINAAIKALEARDG